MYVVHYIVEPGDTLWGIARKFKTTVQAMRNLNIGIADLNLIFPGQLVHVPTDISPQINGGDANDND